MSKRLPDVSWRDDYPMPRRFGRFIRWRGDWAVVQCGGATIRVHRMYITFEN